MEKHMEKWGRKAKHGDLTNTNGGIMGILYDINGGNLLFVQLGKGVF